jgi:hypothetical protein
MARKKFKRGLLWGTRIYLSGPMDFVASRADEKKYGWRNRVSQFLRAMGATVFDPWFKPEVRGFHEYGREDEVSAEAREIWDFRPTPAGARARASCAWKFWQTLHIDLRMVDTSDFTIAYCPTNIYSVGTPHEIILCRQQRKPVLFVSPAVEFPSLENLRSHLQSAKDGQGLKLLATLEQEVPIKPNPRGIPSLWYMPLVGSDSFFDGFGFDDYMPQFPWKPIPLDERETRSRPRRPLLRSLEELNEKLPRKWSTARDGYVPNDDWLLWDLKPTAGPGSEIRDWQRPGAKRR